MRQQRGSFARAGAGGNGTGGAGSVTGSTSAATGGAGSGAGGSSAGSGGSSAGGSNGAGGSSGSGTGGSGGGAGRFDRDQRCRRERGCERRIRRRRIERKWWLGRERGDDQRRRRKWRGSANGCAGKAYKLCEDFETGTSGAIPTGWTKFKGYGAGSPEDAVLATDAFHSGKMALKSSSKDPGQGRIQKSLSALGATASKHWGRVFYKVQSPATKPSSGVLHVTFIGLMGMSENRVVDIVEDSQGKHQWLYNNPDDKGSKGSSYDWTFDAAWHCAEWYVDVGSKSYKFFSDSKEVTQIGFTGQSDSQMSNYTSIIVGSTFYQTPPAPFVMWFDDLAIDDAQVGCQ